MREIKFRENKRYKVTIWEHGKEKPITTKYFGKATEKDIIAFYGLHNADVDKYEIKEL